MQPPRLARRLYEEARFSMSLTPPPLRSGSVPAQEFRPPSQNHGRTRTCVGCGERVSVRDASDLLRLVVAEGEVVFDLAGGAFGRGVHVHARPDCLIRAPRKLMRAFVRDADNQKKDVGVADLGARLVGACNRRMAGLLMAARRLDAVAIGSDASLGALGRDMAVSGGTKAAPLAIVAVDAASVARSAEVMRAAAQGRVLAWSNRSELGTLLGEVAVAICVVRHESIAGELKRMSAAADAGVAAMADGAAGSRRPEAR
jgi:predicted RNA-binding protein YlxR (DUF448 family)